MCAALADCDSSLKALHTALEYLDALCESVDDANKTSLQRDSYQRWTEES